MQDGNQSKMKRCDPEIAENGFAQVSNEASESQHRNNSSDHDYEEKANQQMQKCKSAHTKNNTNFLLSPSWQR